MTPGRPATLPTSPTGRTPQWVVDEHRRRHEVPSDGAAGDATADHLAAGPAHREVPVVDDPAAPRPGVDGHAAGRPAVDLPATAAAVRASGPPEDDANALLSDAWVDRTRATRSPGRAVRASRSPGRPTAWPPRRRPWLTRLVVVTVLAALVATFGPHSLDETRDLVGRVTSARLEVRDGAVTLGVHGDALPPAGVDLAAERLAPVPPLREVSRAHAFLQTQPGGTAPVSFDPCRPVHYVVRPDGAPAGGAALVDEAVQRLSAATGLVFVDDGETDEGPSDDRSAYQPDRYGERWAPVLVTWSDETEDPRLAGSVAGVGGPVTTVVGDHPRVTVSGSVSLDAAGITEILATPDGTAIARSVVVHELAHVVGLAHVDDPTQLMAPRSDPGVTELQAGDLTGLALAGAGACAPWL
ncbi:peptidase M10A and M12B matrixin and adamalysin [Cellulomonas fimi ATCC 484]|uniref:Peptidase M10A and M12B matrixin and adamalysin n=1 Tax=Cellulomonas fimi (strain ATCC 484 / DSM 20113 / JCM 1341 / CCUG 24087 / LMG 16345 / NBRC 15513 / NCIMB 8980 / NCTC 7547 / NRS-133) TaxID=590998 RepID=F4H563_CELFA|nr:peptidase M10A and M12B matrixin and adamalysin [Cellulomonas fimi ATCC 484]